MKSKIFILFLLVSLSVNAQIKNITLQILEKASKEPIASAVFNYGSAINNLDKYAITDKNGKISISFESEECFYQLSSLGYLAVNGKLNIKDNIKIIFMDEDVMNINEVVITGSRTPTPIKLSPVVTQVISGQEMVNAGYGNLQQALMQKTPGMNIQKVGFGNEMSMQGLDARHILFLVDGERLTGEMAGNLDYERFNLHAIQRIEIVKGASSTLYGSRAAGAVINLITKKTHEPVSITAGVRYGQKNEQNYKNAVPKDFLYMFEKNSDRPNLQTWISAGFKKNKFTTQTDIWYSSSDAYYLYQKGNDTKTYPASSNSFLEKDSTIVSYLKPPPMGIEGTEHISVSQKIYFEPNDNLSLQLYGTYFFMNTYDLIQDLYFSQSKDITSGLKVNYNIKNYLSAKLTLHSDFYQRYKRHERIDTRKKVYDSRILQPRLTLQSNYFSNHKIIAGIDYFQDELTSDRFVNRKMTTRALKEWELFIQDSYTISDKWIVEAGIRSNFSKPFGYMGLPKLALKYSPSEHFSYRVNYAMGYRSPSIKELFFNWDHLGMFQIIGDEKLQPEKNQYFSFGAEYSNNKLFLSTNVYGNFFYDKIEGVWKIYDFQYNFEYMNLTNQKLIGIDAILRWSISNNFLLNGSYSYVNVSDTHGVKINTSSPNAATASLVYNYKKQNYKIDVSLSMSFTGTKKFDVQDRLIIDEERTKPDGTTTVLPVSKEAYFRCKLPPYALFNININQKFWNKLKFSVGINNIFNYKPSTLGSGVTMFNIPATPGIRFHTQLQYEF